MTVFIFDNMDISDGRNTLKPGEHPIGAREGRPRVINEY